VLETGRFQRLGSNRERQVQVRVVSATNADLAGMIATGSFREDLYYRLNAIELRLPALAERPDDILPLARHFLPEGRRLAVDAERALLAHSWPGNVRELRNALQRAALLASGEMIHAADLGLPPARARPGAADAPGEGQEPGREQILAALARNDGVLAQTAAELGLSRQALYRRLDRLGIRRD
jgi:DNA-binding NtrC family response regulator